MAHGAAHNCLEFSDSVDYSDSIDLEVGTMETLTANEARIGFGDALQKAQHGPVQITKSGKPFAVIMSMEDFRATEEMKLAWLKEKLARAEKDLQEGNFVDGETFMQGLIDGIRD